MEYMGLDRVECSLSHLLGKADNFMIIRSAREAEEYSLRIEEEFIHICKNYIITSLIKHLPMTCPIPSIDQLTFIFVFVPFDRPFPFYINNKRCSRRINTLHAPPPLILLYSTMIMQINCAQPGQILRDKISSPSLPLPLFQPDNCVAPRTVEGEDEIRLKLEQQESNHYLNNPPSKSDGLAGKPEIIRAVASSSDKCKPIMIICRTNGVERSCGQREDAQRQDSKKINSNQTKNIAKNYGKAIIAFIFNNKKLFRQVCKQTSTPYQRIYEQLPEIKKILTTVIGFRKIWTKYKYSECMRVVSNIFLRKNAMNYIFNSKIANIQTHIKYRTRFLQALCDPQNFDHIKEY